METPEHDKPQVQLGVAVPLLGTTSDAAPLADRRILSVEQAADYQGAWVHIEHSDDGTTFSPLVSVERSPARLILLDLAGPRDGFIRIRLDMPQANVRTFFVTTR